MNGQRAYVILASFDTGKLVAFTAKEIEELLKAGLVVEADPRDMTTLAWLAPVVQEHAAVPLGDPAAIDKLADHHAELDERLKSDWHRFTTTDAHLADEERVRRELRRALAVLRDPAEVARLVRVVIGAKYLACAELGDERYAITARGARIALALAYRLDRYRELPLAAFLKAFDKSETKMAAFSSEIATMSNNIGYVKKNPHQVVIGLAKTGAPAAQALDTYHRAKRSAGAADVAVTLARNAEAHGGLAGVQRRLEHAIALLQRAGFPWIPATAGAAKTLLPFDPLETGVERLKELAHLVSHDWKSELAIKRAARLMPASGTPGEVFGRVGLAHQALQRHATSRRDESGTAIAMAAMVRTDDAIEPLAIRLRELGTELARVHAQADPLECVGCPGTPREVAITVHDLMWSVARSHGRAQPNGADAAVAVAFAKRFAY